MKSRYGMHPATAFLLLTAGTVLLSWLGSIYGWEGVRNLLSPEGLRWVLRHVESSFTSAPFLGGLFLLMLGGGVWMHSGWLHATRCYASTATTLSQREKRAWWSSLVLGGGWLTLWGILAWGPWNGVRSIQNGLWGSPLWDGTLCWLSVGMGVVGATYGFLTDRYRTDRDVVRGLSFGFSCFPEFWVIFFFIAQFFAVLDYSGLPFCLAVAPEMLQGVYIFCILLSFVFVFEKKHISL